MTEPANRPTKAATTSARRLPVAAAAIAAVAALALVPTASFAGTPVTPGTSAQVAALVKASVNITAVSTTVAAELPDAPFDIADTEYHITPVCETPAAGCVFGDTAATPTIVLWGNSHARMWLPALIPVATTDGYRIVLLGKNQCPVVDISLPNGTFPGCNAVTKAVIKEINALKPAVVLLADRTVNKGYTAAKWEAGMKATITAIKPAGAQVAIIADIQEFTSNPLVCLARYPSAVQKDCAIPNPNPKEKGLASAESAAAKATKTGYIATNQWLCTTKHCSPIIGTFVAYWDNDHITVTYSQYLATVFGDAVQPFITASRARG